MIHNERLIIGMVRWLCTEADPEKHVLVIGPMMLKALMETHAPEKVELLKTRDYNGTFTGTNIAKHIARYDEDERTWRIEDRI